MWEEGSREAPPYSDYVALSKGKKFLECWSEFRLDTSLLADFVGSNPIKLFVAFDGNYFGTICVDRVVGTFSQ